MGGERVEAARPGPAVGGQPGVELGEGLGPEAVPAALRLGPDDDEPGLAQRAQVLRHGRLGEVEELDQVGYRPVAVAQLVEDPPPVRSYPPGSWGPNAIHQLIAPNAWRLPFERTWRETRA